MAKVKRLRLTIPELEEFRESYSGYCTECGDFTTDQCEPDAENYECTECGVESVHGAENALIMGMLHVVAERIDQ